MNLKNFFLATDTKKAKFARSIGVSPALLHQWIEGIRPVAIGHCPTIERESGGLVTRKDLRDKDWQKIWPELATPNDQPAGPP